MDNWKKLGDAIDGVMNEFCSINYENIINAIDLSLYSVLLGYHGNDRDVDEELCRELAEAALKAMQRMLDRSFQNGNN